MTQIKVYTREDLENGFSGTDLRNLKPRIYMINWEFEKVLKYAKEELYWEDINSFDIVGFEFYNKEQHWTKYISNPNFKE